MKRSPVRRKALKPKRRKHPMGSFGVSAINKKPWYSKDHLDFVRSQKCVVCGSTATEAHHIREAFPRTMGVRIGDDWTVPLCNPHHGGLHARSKTFWQDVNLNPIDICRILQGTSPAWRKAREELKWIYETHRARNYYLYLAFTR